MTHPLKGFVEMLMQEEPETKQVRVGKVSPTLAERLDKLITEHEGQHEQMRAKIDAYVNELSEKARIFVEHLEAEHEPLCDEFHKKQSEVWEEIYDELNLPEVERVDGYAINHIGVVVREVEVTEENKQTHSKGNQVH